MTYLSETLEKWFYKDVDEKKDISLWRCGTCDSTPRATPEAVAHADNCPVKRVAKLEADVARLRAFAGFNIRLQKLFPTKRNDLWKRSSREYMEIRSQFSDVEWDALAAGVEIP
jgi:hypothetical protein